MKLIASRDFTLKGEYFFENDEVKIKDFATIVKLNENGFIKPLSIKELIALKKELEQSNINKREEEE